MIPMAETMTLEQLEELASQLPADKQLKLVSHLTERLSLMLLPHTEPDEARWRKEREAFADAIIAACDAVAESIEGEFDEVIARGEVIEDYPQDKYGPSCLIYGVTAAGRHLHVQCSYPQRPKVKIITVYEPDFNEWIDFKVRRQSNEV